MNKSDNGETLQVMPVGTVGATTGETLSVSGYRLIMFDAEVTLTIGGNNITWPKHKELGIHDVTSLVIVGTANYMLS